MDRDLFIQNVKKYCYAKGELPTIACKKAGVGASFISDINRGRTPSVEKVQKFADYLGITTSELLGETEAPTSSAFKKNDACNHQASKLSVDFSKLVEETNKRPILSQKEIAIVEAYRNADERTRQMVDLALEPYSPPASAETAM